MAEAPDVRVRLSAEGVDEVVRALERVKRAGTDAGKAGKAGGKGLGLMNEALGDLKTLLPTLGIAAAVGGLGLMTRQALDTADAVGKLSTKTGFSAETLSVMQHAAGLADASFESMGKGVIKFNKTMADLEEGGTTSAEAVQRLFGNAKALNGLNTEQRFFKVVDALGKMEAGYKKTKAAQDFFGKGGAELIPLLNDLAGEGFAKAREEAEKLGLIVDQDLADAAQRANDDITRMKNAAEGAAIQFASGLAPAIADVAEALLDTDTKGAISGFKALGDAAGWLLKAITTVFVLIGTNVGTGLAIAEESVRNFIAFLSASWDVISSASSGIANSFSKALSGDFAGAREELKKGYAAVKGDIGRYSRELVNEGARLVGIRNGWAEELGTKIGKIWYGSGGDSGGKKGGGGDDETTAPGKIDKAAVSAALNLAKARIEYELSLMQKYQALLDQESKQAYDRGLRSLSEYLEDRRKSIVESFEAEERALLEKRDLISSSAVQGLAEELKKTQEIEAIDSQIAQKRIDREMKLNELETERWEKEKAIKKAQADAEQTLLTAQGKTYEAALASIRAQAEELKKSGVDPQTINNLTSALTRQAQMQDLEARAGGMRSQLSLAQGAIQNKEDAGQLFPFQALDAYRASVQAAIPDMRALADEMARIAATPEEKARVEAFRQEIDALAISTDKSAQEMKKFKADLQDALQADLYDFFTRGIEQAESFGDAMRGLALSVVDSLRKMAAQMLSTYLTQKLLGSIGGMGMGFSGGGLVPGYASGGMVYGPGTGTSDSVPARLSRGEFVVREAVVSKPGVLAHLIALNGGKGSMGLRSRGVPKFATGGLVTASETIAQGATVQADFGLEEGVIAKKMQAFMRGPDGQRITIENIGTNSKRANQALGGR